MINKHVHIMSRDLKKYISRLKDIDSVSFHYEATNDHDEILKEIRKKF